MERVSFRPAVADDFEFSFELLRVTMREYVEQLWGWDEDFQLDRFRDKFASGAYQILCFDDQDIGLNDVHDVDGARYLSEIQIHPAFQNRGLGSSVNREIMDAAERDSLPVTLQVLKVNGGAKRLYERLGFLVTGETETHYLMRWTASA